MLLKYVIDTFSRLSIIILFKTNISLIYLIFYLNIFLQSHKSAPNLHSTSKKKSKPKSNSKLKTTI